MEFKEITKEELMNCRDYVPLAEKMDFVTNVAMACFDKLNIAGQDGTGGSIIQIPSMYKEDLDRKCRYLMGALAKMYFGADFETENEEDPWLMTIPEYDYWNGGHLMNQIDRFKSDSELRNKCFDIISDYKDLEKKLNAEVFGLLHAMNDSVSRLVVSIESSTTPQALQQGISQLEEAKAKLDEYAKKTGETDE